MLKCPHCGKKVMKLWLADAHTDLRLCHNCHQEVTECACCGSPDLIEDMAADGHFLYCESCASSPDSQPDNSPLLGPDNWKPAVARATLFVPPSLQRFILCRFHEHSIEIVIGEVPGDRDEDEIFQISVKIAYRPPAKGTKQASINNKSGPPGPETQPWPTLRFDANTVRFGRAVYSPLTVDDLTRSARLAILAALSAGGFLFWDRRGCFYLPTGEPIPLRQ